MVRPTGPAFVWINQANGSAAIDPHVPGATGSSPQPNHVAKRIGNLQKRVSGRIGYGSLI